MSKEVGGRSDNYLTHVCRLAQSVQRLERIEKSELSASTVAFINCTLKLAGASVVGRA